MWIYVTIVTLFFVYEEWIVLLFVHEEWKCMPLSEAMLALRLRSMQWTSSIPNAGLQSVEYYSSGHTHIQGVKSKWEGSKGRDGEEGCA